MSEIVKYSGDGLSGLERKVFDALSAIKVRESSDKKLKTVITSGFTVANFNLGVKPPADEKELEKFVNERQIIEAKIFKDIKIHFAGLTLEDIEIAFDLGSKGEFKSKPEEVIFISPEKIYSWLKAYKEKIKDPAQKKKIELDTKLQKKEDYSQEEKQRLIKESENYNSKCLIEEFQKFLEGNTPYDPLNVLYDFLDRKGKVLLSNDRKKEIYKSSEEEFKRAHSNSNSIGDHFKNKKILQEMENGSTKIQAIIKMMAKQKALKVIFQDLKDMEMTMEEFLNE